jgi:hypothetical protein
MGEATLKPADDEQADLLVTEAIRYHKRFDWADKLTLKYAIAAGEKLIQAKAIFGKRHGKWTKWLGENCSAFGQATAYRYMDLAKYRDKNSHV